MTAKRAKRKNPHAAALGRLGGIARAKALGPAGVRRIAKKASAARMEKLSAARRKQIASAGGQAFRRKMAKLKKEKERKQRP